MGVRISPKATWNLRTIASLLYQVYITLAIKLCPAKDPKDDEEFVLVEEKKDEDEDEDTPEFSIKYIGDPVSKLVYNKNEIGYFYSVHYDHVQELVKELIKVFNLVENMIRLGRKRIYN